MKLRKLTYEQALEALLLGSVIKTGDEYYILESYEEFTGYETRKINPETWELDDFGGYGLSLFLGFLRRDGAEEVVYTGILNDDKIIEAGKISVLAPCVFLDSMEKGKEYELTRRYDDSFHMA